MSRSAIPDSPAGFLRTQPSSVPDYHKVIAELVCELDALPLRAHRKRAKCAGKLGALLYLTPERASESERLLQEALLLSEPTNRRSSRLYVANLLRLAISYQYAGKHEKAIQLFDQCLHAIAELRVRGYKHYVFQHKAKCLVEANRPDDARSAFKTALILRRRKGDAALVASTLEGLSQLESYICRRP